MRGEQSKTDVLFHPMIDKVFAELIFNIDLCTVLLEGLEEKPIHINSIAMNNEELSDSSILPRYWVQVSTDDTVYIIYGTELIQDDYISVHRDKCLSLLARHTSKLRLSEETCLPCKNLRLININLVNYFSKSFIENIRFTSSTSPEESYSNLATITEVNLNDYNGVDESKEDFYTLILYLTLGSDAELLLKVLESEDINTPHFLALLYERLHSISSNKTMRDYIAVYRQTFTVLNDESFDDFFSAEKLWEKIQTNATK